MAYTQDQLNQMLRDELAARPGSSRSDIEKQAASLGITKQQVSDAYASLSPTPPPAVQQTPNAATPTGATEQTLSKWAAPYVTDMLGKTKALVNQPYQAYTGPLTAGASDLQTQAFQGLAGLTVPSEVGAAAGTAQDIAGKYGNLSYDPTQFTTGTFGTAEAQKYMNPYLMASLTPQLEEARRQAQISRMGDAARLSKAGAFGGSRQAIMESEMNRNLMDKQNAMIGTGFNTAYDKAMAQFNAEQQRALDAQKYGEESRQFGADYGLKGLEGQLSATRAQSELGLAGLNANRNILSDQLGAGNVQRDITSEGIAADKAQFEEERAWPYQALQFQQSMLSGLPLSTTRTYGTGNDALTNALLGASAFGSVGNILTGNKTTVPKVGG